MYRMDAKVRYSESDESAMMTIDALINYLQDCCCFQSEELDRGVDYLAEHRVAWVLGGWEIEVNRMPGFTEEIQITTWPTDFKGILAYRNFEVRSRQEVLIQVNSTWIFMDMAAGRPIRIPKEVADVYELEAPLEVPRPPKHMPVPDEEHLVRQEPVVVQRQHLDTNHHMNNGQYVRIGQQYIPEELGCKKLCGLSVLYRRSAVLGDLLYPDTEVLDDRVYVRLGTNDAQPYAAMEFRFCEE